jgi:hypothetical protein
LEACFVKGLLFIAGGGSEALAAVLQGTRLLDMSAEIRNFIAENDAHLKAKG